MSENRTTFQSNPKSLEDLLKAVRSGKVQLPDFQRRWVWDDDRVKGLLASNSSNYPIGPEHAPRAHSEGAGYVR
jgi:uncharacterized protein with ParB-like and HNH nuclease domain